MKGHTKIELRDVKTGKVQVIDEDNMVTLGLQKMLQPFPFFNSFKKNIIGYAIGGVLLFEDSIEENIENYIPPAGNKMIGKGAYGFTYTGEVVEFGSFNNVESGLQEDGSAKLVWDFNTSQANGKISCVSLTSLLGGYLGLGDSVYEYSSEKKYNLLDNIGGLDNTTTDGVLYMSFSDNICIFEKTFKENYPADTGILSFVKTRIPISNISLFDSCIYLNNSYNGTALQIDQTKAEEINISIPQKVLSTFKAGSSNFSYNGGVVKYFADGKIRYIFYSAENVPVNGIFHLCIIDAKTNQMEVKDIINTAIGTIYISSLKYGYKTYRSTFETVTTMAVTSKYIFCFAKKNNVWEMVRINVKDNSDISVLDYTLDSFNDFRFIFTSEEKIIFKDRTNTGYILDTESCIISKFNYSALMLDYEGLHYACQLQGNPMILYSFGYYKAAKRSLNTYPVPILTINNLAEPVTKTSAHTMKVTYTLSES